MFSVKHGVQQRQNPFNTDDEDEEDEQLITVPPHVNGGPFMIRLHNVDMHEFMTNIRRRMQ